MSTNDASTPSVSLNPNPRTGNSSGRSSIHLNTANNTNDDHNDADLHRFVDLMAQKQTEEEKVKPMHVCSVAYQLRYLFSGE